MGQDSEIATSSVFFVFVFAELVKFRLSFSDVAGAWLLRASPILF